MSGPVRDGGEWTQAFIRDQAERCEEMALTDPEGAERWQAEANAWRVELPPAEIEPGPITDADFIEIEP